MAVSADGKRLAAVAADCHMFLYEMTAGKLLPHMASQLPGARPASCCWSENARFLLLGCGSGVAVEVDVPLPGSVDTSM
jgi:hypothetical protein